MGGGSRRFRAGGTAVGVLILIAIAGAAVGAPVLSSDDPIHQDFDHGLTALGAPVGPCAQFPLGTDPLGRNVWARLLHGGRTSLAIALLATSMALALGVAVGLFAGFFGGVVDALLMRTVDLVLAFPYLLLAIALATLVRASGTGGGIASLAVVLAAVGWTTIARLIRTEVLRLRECEFITAARALGISPARILWRHLAPHIVAPILVLGSLLLGQMTLAEATLSYVGLGPPPPAPSWGRMLFEGQAYYRSAPHLVLAPGTALVLTIAGFNLVGEGFRDALGQTSRARPQ